ncbi:thiamine-phosphate pyrophosphorylase [Nitratifractor sp.]
MSDPATAKVQRIIDANLNRLREGLRVLEDLNRYFWDDEEISRQFKELRHGIARAYSPERLRYRDIENDVLKESSESEMQRSSLSEILTANFSRAQESSRVLEELFKLNDPSLSALFKETRYRLYGLEKRIQTEKILPNP